jgi:hypothetical protein
MMKIKAKQKINRTESWNGKGLENGRRRRRRRRRRKKNTRKRIRESKIPPPACVRHRQKGSKVFPIERVCVCVLDTQHTLDREHSTGVDGREKKGAGPV